MAFDLNAFLLLAHVAGAALWVGSTVFLKFVVMDNVEKAGPAGKGYMLTVVRNGGWGKFIGPSALLAILAGLLLYYRLGIHQVAMEGANAWLTIGMLTGLAGLVVGLSQVVPREAKMRKIANAIPVGSPPNPEQGKELEGLAAGAKRFSLYASSLAWLTFLLMAGRNVFY